MQSLDYNVFSFVQEELIRAKTDDVHSSVVSKNIGCFQGHNARESLNQLRVSLNRSLLLSNLDSNTDEAANVNEDDIRQIHQQFDELDSSCEWNAKDISVSEDGVQFYSFDEYYDEDTTIADENLVGDSISCSKSPILDEPPLSESPKFSNSKRKSVAISSSYLGSRNTVEESSAFRDDVLGKSLKHGEHKRVLLQSSKADFLAESLQRGLQIIDYHQQNLTLNKSSSSFSFGRLTLTPCPEIDKVQPYDQTLQQKVSNDEVTSTFLCASCSTDLTDKVPNVCFNLTSTYLSFKSTFY